METVEHGSAENFERWYKAGRRAAIEHERAIAWADRKEAIWFFVVIAPILAVFLGGEIGLKMYGLMALTVVFGFLLVLVAIVFWSPVILARMLLEHYGLDRAWWVDGAGIILFWTYPFLLIYGVGKIFF